MAPALADDHDNHQGNGNNGRGHGGYNGNRGRGHGYHGERYGYYGNQHGYQQTYQYRRPAQPNGYIYAPPPVYYPPLPSEGLNLFLPFNVR